MLAKVFSSEAVDCGIRCLLLRLDVLSRVGLTNVWRFAWYRLLLRSGWYRLALPRRPCDADRSRFFSAEAERQASSREASPDFSQALEDRGQLAFFSRHARNVGFPPDWLHDPFSRRSLAGNDVHWSEIDEFSLPTGDVKVLWEISRFAHLHLIVADHQQVDAATLSDELNDWFVSWQTTNAVNTGVNWRCGQETAIRLMHSLVVAQLVWERKSIATTPAFDEFVRTHCQRIRRTMLYGRAQDNNHAISEAAGLYMGASYLQNRAGSSRRTVARWKHIGLRALYERLQSLFEQQGSFAQHSTNYHRMVLDILSALEWWRRSIREPEFGAVFYERARAATDWLAAMVDATSGDAPNLGHNDGALLFPLSLFEYREFRPTVQFAGALFAGKSYYRPGHWNERLRYYGIRPADGVSEVPAAMVLDRSYARLSASSQVWAVLRVPRYRFRPAHCDGLHLDLWVRGVNLLRDAGSYSYAADPDTRAYFSSPRAHNTIQFDDEDQMPKLARFMFAKWLDGSVTEFDPAALTVAAKYVDWRARAHERKIELRAHYCRIEDRVAGSWRKATLRWRLPHGDWRIDGTAVSDGRVRLEFDGDFACEDLSVGRGWESRHYLERTEVSVVELALKRGASRIATTVEFAAANAC